jgi:hypothetical protein
VYFPTTSITSLLYVMEDGASAEIAVVGNDGIVGVSLFMGGESTTSRAVVQSAGQGYRLKANLMMLEFNRAGPVLHLLLRYTQALITQMAQTAVCNRHHSLDQQLCRWLLLSLDRLPSNELVMTQELIANMLGVRREGVTESAGNLHRRASSNTGAATSRCLTVPARTAHLRVLRRGQEEIRPPAARHHRDLKAGALLDRRSITPGSPRCPQHATTTMIRIELQVELSYEVDEHGADFVFNIHAAHTASQAISAESLVLRPGHHAANPHRRGDGQPLHAPARPARRTEAVVHGRGGPHAPLRQPVADCRSAGARPAAGSHGLHLPEPLLPVRRLVKFAINEFGGLWQGYSRVQAIQDGCAST